jgi:hypothetical protein
MANEHVWLNSSTVKKFTTLDHDGNKDILFEIYEEENPYPILLRKLYIEISNE